MNRSVIFHIALYASLIIFGLGMVYKLSSWFWQNVGTGQKEIPMSGRLYGAVKGVARTLLSLKVFSLIKAFFLDVILQFRVLKDRDDRMLWIMHLLIFVGFTLLLLLHALESIVTTSLFSDYQPTLNPFLFLRDLLGLFVVLGLSMALVRRVLLKRGRIKTSVMDTYVILILAVVVISGFLLEGTKMSSLSAFQRMVEDYGEPWETAQVKALEGYWVKHFGLVTGEDSGAGAARSMAEGEQMHESSCSACHSRPQWAFVSHTVSRVARPFALAMDRAGVQTALWTVHFLACFIGLAYLPFSKFFHIFATPVSLFVAAVTTPGTEAPVNMATRQMIELDGCKHGGACHRECPVWQKRRRRIDMSDPFGPIMDHVADKDWRDLGNRQDRDS